MNDNVTCFKCWKYNAVLSYEENRIYKVSCECGCSYEFEHSSYDAAKMYHLKMLELYAEIDKNNRLRAENDRLQSELSILQEADRWIPVTERLPDEGIEVLGMDENGRRVVCEYSTRCFGWISEVDAMGDIVCWCPLPADPKGGAQG